VYIPAILPTKMQTMKPSKRKIVKTVYTTEKFTHDIQKDLPKSLRGIAQSVSDFCHNARNYMTKVN
jgi:hypothetical protein